MFDAHSLEPLREVVARHQIRAAKALGQNFLFDINITNKIVRGAAIAEGTHVIEIGPGPGGLTRSLLMSRAASVTVVEKDERCIAALNELKALVGERLSILHGDALDIELSTLVPAPRMIVANLPYNVATELLFNWLEAVYANPSVLTSMTLMFQKEVAERIASPLGVKAYGRVSILTQWLCETRVLFDLPPSAFSPPPKVTSSVIQIVPRNSPLAAAEKPMLERVVQAAFGQRRKMLRSSLKALQVDTGDLLNEAGIAEELRAEQLSVEQFCALARAYASVLTKS